MSPEAARLIWQRMDFEPPLLLADRLEAPLADSMDRLVQLGLVRATTPSLVSFCPDCGPAHQTRVFPALDPSTGSRRFYLQCPECGLVEVPVDSLRRWFVDIPSVLELVCRGTGMRGAVVQRLPGRLWQLGTGSWAGRSREVYFARAFDPEHLPAVVAEMSGHPKAILLAPTERHLGDWKAATGNVVVALESVLSVADGTLSFDHDQLRDRLIDAGQADVATSKRPARKRGSRTADIERLVKEMKEHVRAARDHAFATKQLTGTPKLLPRPSQQELARRTGMRKWTVTRCLNDEAAWELRFLWELAGDLDQIMAWSERG